MKPEFAVYFDGSKLLNPALDPGWSPRQPRGSELTDSQFDQPIVEAFEQWQDDVPEMQ